MLSDSHFPYCWSHDAYGGNAMGNLGKWRTPTTWKSRVFWGRGALRPCCGYCSGLLLENCDAVRRSLQSTTKERRRGRNREDVKQKELEHRAVVWNGPPETRACLQRFLAEASVSVSSRPAWSRQGSRTVACTDHGNRAEQAVPTSALQEAPWRRICASQVGSSWNKGHRPIRLVQLQSTGGTNCWPLPKQGPWRSSHRETFSWHFCLIWSLVWQWRLALYTFYTQWHIDMVGQVCYGQDDIPIKEIRIVDDSRAVDAVWGKAEVDVQVASVITAFYAISSTVPWARSWWGIWMAARYKHTIGSEWFQYDLPKGCYSSCSMCTRLVSLCASLNARL